MKSIIYSILAIITLSSCAGTYNHVNPSGIQYVSKKNISDVEFSYKYGVLSERGNKKYVKKETVSGLQVVSVKIVNNSEKTLVFNQNYFLMAEDTRITTLPPNYVVSRLKQGVPIYLLYMLLTPMQFSSGNTDGAPIGLILGPGITAFNMVTAGQSNGKLRKELEDHDLNTHEIAPGETFYGLMGISNTGYAPLSIELKE